MQKSYKCYLVPLVVAVLALGGMYAYADFTSKQYQSALLEDESLALKARHNPRAIQVMTEMPQFQRLANTWIYHSSNLEYAGLTYGKEEGIVRGAKYTTSNQLFKLMRHFNARAMNMSENDEMLSMVTTANLRSFEREWVNCKELLDRRFKHEMADINLMLDYSFGREAHSCPQLQNVATSISQDIGTAIILN